MTRRSKVWLTVATLFTLINLGGALFAAAGAEWLHATVHVGLVVIGAFSMLRLTARSRLPQIAGADEMDERLAQLQRSVDAVAIEVERIGEAQRYAVKLAAQPPEKSPVEKRDR